MAEWKCGASDQEKNGKTTSIDCEAVKCVYNDNYMCHAEHVDIKGSSACDCKETECATFRDKCEGNC